MANATGGGFIGGWLAGQKMADDHEIARATEAIDMLSLKQKITTMRQEQEDKKIYANFDPTKPNAYTDLAAQLILRGNPKAGLGLLGTQAKLQESQAKTLEALAGIGQKNASAAKNTIEATVKQNELTGQYYNDVTDQKSLDAANSQLKAAGVTPTVTTYDADRVKMIRDSAVTAAQKEKIQHDRAVEANANAGRLLQEARLQQAASFHAQSMAMQGARLSISKAELGIKGARLAIEKQKMVEKEQSDQLQREGKKAAINEKLGKLAVPDKARFDLAKGVANTMPGLEGLSDQERDSIARVAAARAGKKMADNLRRAGKTADEFDTGDFEQMIRDELKDISENEISTKDTGFNIMGFHLGGTEKDVHLGTKNAPKAPASKEAPAPKQGSRSVSGKITPAGTRSVDDLIQQYAK